MMTEHVGLQYIYLEVYIRTYISANNASCYSHLRLENTDKFYLVLLSMFTSGYFECVLFVYVRNSKVPE